MSVLGVALLAAGMAASPPKDSSPDEKSARVALKSAERLAADPKADPDKLWQHLVALRRSYPGTRYAIRASQLMARARSPLDQFDPERIPEKERFKWQPEGLVAVLGQHARRHWGQVIDVAFSPDGTLVASLSIDGLRLWDATTMREVLWLEKGESCAFSPDGNMLLVGDSEWAGCLYDVVGGKLKKRATLPGLLFAFAPDGKTLAASERGGAVCLYDLVGGKLKKRATLRDEDRHVVGSLVFAPHGRALAVFYPDVPQNPWDVRIPDAYVIWEWGNAGVKKRVLGQQSGARPGGGFMDGGNVFVHSDGVWCYVWGVGKAAPGLRFKLRNSGDSALSPDGKTLVLTAPDQMTFWDATALKPTPLGSMEDRLGFNRPHFSPDGRLLARTSGQRLFIWEMADIQRQLRGDGPAALSRQVRLPFIPGRYAFSPDSRLLVCGGHHGFVHLWDLTREKELFPFGGHCGYTQAAFSPDGHKLATSAEDGSLRLWELTGPRPTNRVLKEPQLWEEERIIGFASSGDVLVCRVHPEGDVHFWDLRGHPARRSPPLDLSQKGADITYTTPVALCPRGPYLLLAGYETFVNVKEYRQSLVGIWQLGGRMERPREKQSLRVGEAVDPLEADVSVQALACSADGHRLAVLRERDLHLLDWDVDKRRPPVMVKPHSDRSWGAAFSLDGKQLVTCGTDEELDKDRVRRKGRVPRPLQSIRIWDVEAAPRKRSEFRGDEGDVLAAEFALADDHILAQFFDQACVLFDKKWRKRWQWRPPHGDTHFVLAPDRRHVALCNSNGTIYIIRLPCP
jgi:WD40 repeat protein